jgi:hypothetical protein
MPRDAELFLQKLRTAEITDPDKTIAELACEGCGHCARVPEPCEDCFFCGCPQCPRPEDGWDGYMTYPPSQYEERKRNLEKRVCETIRAAAVPLDEYLTLFSPGFIIRNFPWSSSHATIWRNRVFPHQKEPLRWMGTDAEYNALAETDKVFFYKTRTAQEFAINYNVLRIMSGMRGLNYPF